MGGVGGSTRGEWALSRVRRSAGCRLALMASAETVEPRSVWSLSPQPAIPGSCVSVTGFQNMHSIDEASGGAGGELAYFYFHCTYGSK